MLSDPTTKAKELNHFEKLIFLKSIYRYYSLAIHVSNYGKRICYKACGDRLRIAKQIKIEHILFPSSLHGYKSSTTIGEKNVE